MGDDADVGEVDGEGAVASVGAARGAFADASVGHARQMAAANVDKQRAGVRIRAGTRHQHDRRGARVG
jgi:hypothetical protein